MSFLAWTVTVGYEETCNTVDTKIKYNKIDDGKFFVAVMVMLWLYEMATCIIYMTADTFLASLPFNWNLFVS